MIKSITITNHLGESCEMILARPDLSGFLISRIDGLGPPKADINMIDLSTNDGARYNSAKVVSRNIVIDLIFHFVGGGPSIETLRQKSYKYFPIKKQVKFLIETNNRICETYGFIESNEPDIFSNGAGCSISIMCPDPYFYSASNQNTVFSGIQSLFEFPFSNESLDFNLIDFGEIINIPEQTVYYSGDADVGIIIYIHAIGQADGLTIHNITTSGTIKIDTVKLRALTGSTIIAGDDIIISTVKGEKYVTLLRDGEYINILNCLDKDVDWIQLSKGDNLLLYTAEFGALNLQFRVENRIAYEGV